MTEPVEWLTIRGTNEFRVDREGAVAVVTIDRSEARNSLTLAAQAELVRNWRELQADDNVRVVVLVGAEDRGRPPDQQAFCTGSDVKELEREAAAGNAFAGFPLDDGFPSLAGDEGTTPVIAAVNGYCIGGGMTLMLASDLRVAGTSATFSLPELQFGGLPGNGGIQRAMAQLPAPMVMELLLLGGRLDATRALQHGLVNAVVDPEDVLDTAMDWARTVAELPPLAVRAAKELAARVPRLGPRDGARLERVFMGVLQRYTRPGGSDEMPVTGQDGRSAQ